MGAGSTLSLCVDVWGSRFGRDGVERSTRNGRLVSREISALTVKSFVSGITTIRILVLVGKFSLRATSGRGRRPVQWNDVALFQGHLSHPFSGCVFFDVSPGRSAAVGGPFKVAIKSARHGGAIERLPATLDVEEAP